MNSSKTLLLYTTGFILSLILTFVAYLSVVNHFFIGGTLITAILLFAILQLIVQLFFFLHLGKEAKPYWNLVFFVSTLFIILIIVIGSIWIMNHLNYNMMPPAETSKYIMKDEGIHR